MKFEKTDVIRMIGNVNLKLLKPFKRISKMKLSVLMSFHNFKYQGNYTIKVMAIMIIRTTFMIIMIRIMERPLYIE